VGGEEAQQVTDIYIARTDGTDIANITDDEFWQSGRAVWSPNDHKFVYGLEEELWQIELVLR
jgi:hypothetical protein